MSRSAQSIDYRTLLDRAVTYSVYDNDEVGLAILVTRIPDLCPDCDEHGYVTEEYGHGAFDDVIARPCTHPNAPTIADLLRWGENVATRTPHTRRSADLLASLRTEAEQSGADR